MKHHLDPVLCWNTPKQLEVLRERFNATGTPSVEEWIAPKLEDTCAVAREFFAGRRVLVTIHGQALLLPPEATLEVEL